MKYSDLTPPDPVVVSIQPRCLRKPEAEKYVGGQRNLKTLRRVGWLKPLVEHKGNTTFLIEKINEALDRASKEGWPS